MRRFDPDLALQKKEKEKENGKSRKEIFYYFKWRRRLLEDSARYYVEISFGVNNATLFNSYKEATDFLTEEAIRYIWPHAKVESILVG